MITNVCLNKKKDVKKNIEYDIFIKRFSFAPRLAFQTQTLTQAILKLKKYCFVIFFSIKISKKLIFCYQKKKYNAQNFFLL